MGTQLINVVAFTAVPAAGSTALPHGINVNGVDMAPDFVAFSVGDFTAVVTSTTVTVTNNGSAPADCNVWCELKHTTQRWFGAAQTTSLTPRPFIAFGGGGGSSGGAFQTQWIYRPGSGATGPVVYADFDELYTSLDAVRVANGGLGSYQITMDGIALSPVPIPNASYDMSGVTWVGNTNFSQVTVEIADGASIIFLVEIKNCGITRSAFVSNPPLAVDASAPPARAHQHDAGAGHARGHRQRLSRHG